MLRTLAGFFNLKTGVNEKKNCRFGIRDTCTKHVCEEKEKHFWVYMPFKSLVAITPNGAISYVSPCYGGRASDIFIARDSGVLNMIEPYDEIMPERGFKFREDLMMHMATLCIPPSCASSIQLLPRDVRETSNIANVRIHVEQAIGRL